MLENPITPAEAAAAPRPRAGADRARAPAMVLESLILHLLALLFGRPRRPRAWHIARCDIAPWHIAPWHHAPERPSPAEPPRPLRVRSIHDGTHLVCEHPILWVIGPGPNRGMRPHARPTPRLRPRSARAPPLPHQIFELPPSPLPHALFVTLSQ
jgi:hypothetical protein